VVHFERRLAPDEGGLGSEVPLTPRRLTEEGKKPLHGNLSSADPLPVIPTKIYLP
jgi:hypothetical protein